MATGTELMPEKSKQINQAAQSEGKLKIGEQVSGYTITGLISFKGGEGEIYSCEKKTAAASAARYALKCYYTLVDNTVILEKLKTLRHKNIMALYEYGTYRGTTFAVYQFVEGGSLGDKIEKDNSFKFLPLSEEKTVGTLYDILESLKTIHEEGIIHRDIKPDNFLFLKSQKDDNDKWTGEGFILGDFGIASPFEVEEKSHLTVTNKGTEGYIAPETNASGKIEGLGIVRMLSPAIDYWALGISIWVLLTGKEPFTDENGKRLSFGQIQSNARNNETAKVLLARSPQLSEKMKKLIRGLLTTRSSERWDYQKVKDHLAGKDVKIFEQTVRDMPVFKIGNKDCFTWREIASGLLANPKEGKKIVFGTKLKDYMWGEIVAKSIVSNAQELAEKFDALIEEYSSKGKEDEGFFHVAYSIDPLLPFVLSKENNIEIKSPQDDIKDILKTDPDVLIPFLRDENLGFYAYLKVQKYDDIGEKVREVVNHARSDIKMIGRLQSAFMDDVISPFKDGINDGRELRELEQLDDLPENLKERILIFIQMKRADITAWIENLSKKDLDVWLDKYQTQNNKLVSWGEWNYFKLFLKGKDIQNFNKFSVTENKLLRYGLKDFFGETILTPAWEYVLASSVPDRYIVNRTDKWGVIQGDGTEIIPIAYKMISIFNEEKGLYQCKEEDGSFSLLCEDKNVMRKGAEALRTAGAPDKPFDIIYDSENIYNTNFKPVNKKGSRFIIAKAKENNFIWMIEGSSVNVYNSSMELIAKTPYTDFRSGGITASAAVPVQKSGKWGICSADGQKEILPCSYVDIKTGANYFALVMPGGVGGILCEINEAGEKKDKYWLKFNNEGEVKILPAGGGEALFTFRSVVNLSSDYPYEGDFAPNGKMSCMTAGELLYFDIAEGKTTKRDTASKEEFSSILKHSGSMELFVLLSNLKKLNAFTTLNEIIDAAADIDEQTNTSWAIEKGASSWQMILGLLDEDHKDGLANSWDIYLSRIGKEYLKSKKYKDSYGSYAKAIKINPDIPAYHAGCGASYFHLGDYKNAVGFYQKASGLSGNKIFSAQFQAAAGSALYSLTKFNDAMAYFTQAIADSGKNAPAEFFTARAACYQKLNMGDKARDDLATAQKAPNNSGENIRGIPLPGPKASSINIEETAASGSLITILKSIDTLKKEGSVEAMNQLIDLSWVTFDDKKDYDSAAQILKRITPGQIEGLELQYSYYVYMTGMCYYNLEKFTDAVTFFIEAADLEPGNAGLKFDCGNIYYRLKNFTKAKEWYQKAANQGHAKAKESLKSLK